MANNGLTHPAILDWVYFACAVLVGIAWGIAYWRVPKARHELVWLGCISLPHAIPLEIFVWMKDWWNPPSPLGFRPSFGDWLYGFFNCSLMGAQFTIVLYWFFGARREDVGAPPSLALRLAPWLVATLPVPVLYFGFGVHSAVATGLSALAAILLIVALRRDLAWTALMSGAFGFTVGLVTFTVLEPTFPGFVQQYWFLDKLPGFFGIHYIGVGPTEDMLWYTYASAFLGIYHKFWYGYRVVRPVTQAALQPVPA
jgi:hypothetical protein